MSAAVRSSARVSDRRSLAGRPDPVRLEVVHQLLAGVCEEAGAVLQRAAVSPNIRERRDFSLACFDGEGRLIAQAAHIPVHLGSAGASVRAVREALDLRPGDVAVLNDPYQGGTHLPDITMVRPVFWAARGGRGEPDGYLVARAHHADVGGAVPGSMGVARDLHGEGLVLPPVKWLRSGEVDQTVMSLIAANVRNPAERLIDLRAQAAALEHAERRLRTVREEFGPRPFAAYIDHLLDYAEAIARDVVRGLPVGSYRAADQLDDDGVRVGVPVPIRLQLDVIGGRRPRLVFDWTDSAAQTPGGVNACPGVVLAACVYALRCLCPDRLPTNEGVFRAIEVRTTPGTVLEPVRPAPVAGGNVETSQRLVDVAFEALAAACPERIPAASAGTMCNLTVGGLGFSVYETLPGGAGAGPGGPGASAIQTHMTNTRNTPLEEFERVTPLRVTSLTVRRGSGGRGARRGGDGLIKEIEALAPVTVTLFADRANAGPPGAAGGAVGKPLRARLWRAGAARGVRLAAKTTVELQPGDRLRVETPGGGGHGRTARR